MIPAELRLIQKVQTDEFWQDITLPMLETVRRRLRALTKLIEKGRRPLVFTDFEDRVGPSADVIVQGISVGTDLDAFRRKARQFLRPYENHLAILKLKRNEPLTPTDLSELERIFVEAGVDPQGMERLYEAGGLGRFVRSLVGLDREAAKRAFGDFIADRPLSANQLEFLDLVTANSWAGSYGSRSTTRPGLRSCLLTLLGTLGRSPSPRWSTPSPPSRS